jgi:hypothetical protein
MSSFARASIAVALLEAAAAFAQGAPPPSVPPSVQPAPTVPAQPGTLRPVPPLQMPRPAPAPAVPEPRVVPQITIPIGPAPGPVPPLQQPPQAPMQPVDAGTAASQRAALARCDGLQADAARAECRRRVFVDPSTRPGMTP